MRAATSGAEGWMLDGEKHLKATQATPCDSKHKTLIEVRLCSARLTHLLLLIVQRYPPLGQSRLPLTVLKQEETDLRKHKHRYVVVVSAGKLGRGGATGRAQGRRVGRQAGRGRGGLVQVHTPGRDARRRSFKLDRVSCSLFLSRSSASGQVSTVFEAGTFFRHSCVCLFFLFLRER